MEFDFSRNYFELFGLEVLFQVDNDLLDNNYQKLQSEFHPDRFVDSDDKNKRVAMQATTFINEAYKTLRDEQSKARYLLELSGVEFDLEKDTTDDMEFLMAQMSLREEIDEIGDQEDPLERLDQLTRQARDEKKALSENFKKYYVGQDWLQAKDTVLKLQFYNRLQEQINQQQEKLEDELI